MTTDRRQSVRYRAVVAALVAASVALALTQWLGGASWWLELSRYLPYPLLLAPAVAALALSLRLRRRDALAVLAATTLALLLSTGVVWNRVADRADRPAGGFRLMTWNAKADQAMERPLGVDSLAAEIARHDPDLVVMQDAGHLRHLRSEGRGALFGYAHFAHSGQYIVLGRLPLRDCAPEVIGDEALGLDILTCAVDVPGGAVRLSTLHLASPRAGLEAARRDGLDGIGEWIRNHELRLAQAEALAHRLAATPAPLARVLAGDLNAPPSSPVLARLREAGLHDAFALGGRGFGHTYGHVRRPGFSFLRIDYALVDHGIAVDDAFVGGSDASDHRPVIVDLRLASERRAAALGR